MNCFKTIRKFIDEKDDIINEIGLDDISIWLRKGARKR